jgi:hypothetical protein
MQLIGRERGSEPWRVGDTGFKPVTSTLWRHCDLSVRSASDQRLCGTVTPNRRTPRRTSPSRAEIQMMARRNVGGSEIWDACSASLKVS